MTLRSTTARAAEFFRGYGFVLALMGLFLYLTFRNAGLYPMVFADEWSYSSNARLLPFSESIVPSWLYFALFRTTNACGTGFLECARLINVVLYVAAAPLLYLIARRVCTPRVAAWIAVLALLAPVSTYTAYFMPEAMYFTGFCLFAWVALAWRTFNPMVYGLACGAILGLMSIIKVHGLFLMPALLAFMLYICLAGERRAGWWLRALQMMVAAVLAMVLIKLTVGYLLAGPAGLSLFGTFYSGHVNNHSGGIDRILALLPAALVNFKGHALGLALLMSMPAAVLLLHALDKGVRKAASAELRALQVFALLTLGAALGLTVMFTASLAAPGSQEGFRLHLRYYDFVFPLLLMIAAAALTVKTEALSRMRRILVAVPLAALVLYAWVALQPTYAIGIIDSPELASLTRDHGAYRALVVLSVLVLGAWAWQARLGTRLFVFGLLPLTMLVSAQNVGKLLSGAQTASPADRAALAAVNYLGKEGASRLAIAGSIVNVMRAQFHIDSPHTLMVDLPPDAPLKREEISPRHPVLLVLGNHALPEGVEQILKTPEFALVRLSSKTRVLATVALANPLAGAVLTSVDGMWNAEPWGSWSKGKTVTLNFARPLPKALTVKIYAHAFHGNTEKDFFMVVGGQRKPFQLGFKKQDRYFEFDTDGNVTSITIDVPNPVSPASLGQSADVRDLGMALIEIEIGERL